MYPVTGPGTLKFGRTWLKIERAVQHLEELRRRIGLLEVGTFTVSEQRDLETGDRCWVLEQTDADNHLLGVSMYGVIVGDFVHQLRSSLDHAVWKLASPPIERQTAFPICLVDRDQPGSFFGGRGSRAIGPRRLANVPKAAFDFIEAVQPYNRLKAGDPLWSLNELWNEDKHRTLIVIADPTWTQPVAIDFPGGRQAYDGEIKDATGGLEILRLDAKSDAVVSLTQPGPVRIRFGPDVPAVGGKVVLPSLEWTLRYVRDSILPGLEAFI